MKIELREKIQTTEEEFQSVDVNHNDRPTLSELHPINQKKSRHTMAVKMPGSDSITEKFY